MLKTTFMSRKRLRSNNLTISLEPFKKEDSHLKESSFLNQKSPYKRNITLLSPHRNLNVPSWDLVDINQLKRKKKKQAK